MPRLRGQSYDYQFWLMSRNQISSWKTLESLEKISCYKELKIIHNTVAHWISWIYSGKTSNGHATMCVCLLLGNLEAPAHQSKTFVFKLHQTSNGEKKARMIPSYLKTILSVVACSCCCILLLHFVCEFFEQSVRHGCFDDHRVWDKNIIPERLISVKTYAWLDNHVSHEKNPPAFHEIPVG